MGRTSNAPQRREEIAWALFDCLAENGHEKVTVKQIAARAHLPHGVIHYYFEKKDDVVAALVESITATYMDLFEKMLEAAAPTPLERVDRMLEYLVDAFVFDRRLNRVFYNLVQMGFEREGVNAPLRRMLAAYRGTMENVFAEAGAGEAAGPVSRLLVALVEGLALQWMIDPDALDKALVLNLVTQTVKNQLAQGGRPA